MTHPTAHQMIAARRSELTLVLVWDDQCTFLFQGSHPTHGAFTATIVSLSPTDLLVASVTLPGKGMSWDRFMATKEIGRSVAGLFTARFIFD